jgi:uncharacterized damage-inducible protein DinB
VGRAVDAATVSGAEPSIGTHLSHILVNELVFLDRLLYETSPTMDARRSKPQPLHGMEQTAKLSA